MTDVSMWVFCVADFDVSLKLAGIFALVTFCKGVASVDFVS